MYISGTDPLTTRTNGQLTLIAIVALVGSFGVNALSKKPNFTKGFLGGVAGGVVGAILTKPTAQLPAEQP